MARSHSFAGLPAVAVPAEAGSRVPAPPASAEVAQRQDAGAETTGELRSIVRQLERLAAETEREEAEGEMAPGLPELTRRIATLEEIAAGDDEQLKAQALAALKEEIPGGKVAAVPEGAAEASGEAEPVARGQEQARPIQTFSGRVIQRVPGLTVGLVVGGVVVVAGIAALVGGIRRYRRWRRQQQQQIFQEFGDRFRDPDLDPDLIGQHQHGIYVPAGQAARPEDAPVVNYFRTRFHKLHSAKLYLETQHPQLVNGFENDNAHAAALNNLSLRDRTLELAGLVKNESKAHKKRVKDLSTTTTQPALDAQYAQTVRGYGDDAETLAGLVESYIQTHSADTSDLDQIHAAGTDIWRTAWHRTIMAVNTVLHGRWPHWRGRITRWITDRNQQDGLAYMDANQPVGLEYIGSLAKGYKGPPKQAVRFMPEKFDVDANLTSPPLAAYALDIGGAIVDRGRIWSHRSGPLLFNGLLKPMQDDIQLRLVNAGLIQMGMDPAEPFEVVIDAEGVQNLPHAPVGATAKKATSDQDLLIRNRLHALRANDSQRFGRVGAALQQAGLTFVDSGKLLLREHDEDNQTYAFTDLQLTQIDQIITQTP